MLQNKVNRLILNASYDTPTAALLRDTDSLSVQRMIAAQTAVSVYKILKSGKPTYLSRKLMTKSRSMKLRGRMGSITEVGHSLSIAKEGFVHRGTVIFNKLSEHLRNETKLEKFKSGIKEWVKTNIATKPAPKYLSFGGRHYQNRGPRPPDPPAPLAPPQPRPMQNSIRNYFHPV